MYLSEGLIGVHAVQLALTDLGFGYIITQVMGTTGKDEDYFWIRDDVQQIHLSLRAMYNGGRPTGKFCCEFSDASGVTQRQCVDIGLIR